MRRTPMRVVAATVAALAIGGCSADSQPAVCDSLAAAQTTMNRIRTTNVAENGLGVMRTQLQQLRTDVSRLLADAADQFAAEVEAVRAAADQVMQSVTAARETPDAAHFAAVRTTLGTLQAGLRSLGDSMSDTC